MSSQSRATRTTTPPPSRQISLCCGLIDRCAQAACSVCCQLTTRVQGQIASHTWVQRPVRLAGATPPMTTRLVAAVSHHSCSKWPCRSWRILSAPRRIADGTFQPSAYALGSSTADSTRALAIVAGRSSSRRGPTVQPTAQVVAAAVGRRRLEQSRPKIAG